MLTILITGSMGAGKSSAIDFLEFKAYPVFKADTEAKEMLRPHSPCYPRLKQLFSNSFLSKLSEEFDRKKIAEEIFNYPEKRKAMEAIVHPLVQASFKKFVSYQEKQAQSMVFYEASLISQEIFNSFDKLILIVCPKNIKKRRLIKVGWTKKEIEKRWAIQIPKSKVIDKMDFIIDNSGDFKDLHTQIEKVLSLIKTS